MLRPVVIMLLLGVATGAAAQNFPGVAPSVPSPQLNGPPLLGGAPAPPRVMPGPTVSPSYHAPAPAQLYTTRRGRNVLVPSGPPGRQSFGDRVERCSHAAAAAGLGPNHVGSFTRRCAN